MNIPEGFVLVPASMLLEKEVIELIKDHCSYGDLGDYVYVDGRLWIGDLEGDDGEKTHGLHIMTDEYPEEGSSTLVEFPRVELPAYDEAKERELFETFYTERAKTLPLPLGNSPLRYSGGQYINDFALFGWMVWLACAQSRDGSVSNE